MYAFGMWAPTVLKQLSANIGMNALGWLTAIPYAFATLGIYLVSRAADRSRFSRGWYVAAALHVAGLALLGQHVVAGPLTINMVMLVLAGLGIHSALGTWWSWALANVPRNQAGPAIVKVDVANRASAEQMATATLKAFGKIDVLINNGAIFSILKMKPFDEIGGDEWDRMMAVNARGVFFSVQAVAPSMKKAKYGKIINISSSVVATGRANYAH